MPRLFSPSVATTPSSFGTLSEGERQTLAAVTSAFLASDDPYLDADELTRLAERLNLNERNLHRDLERLAAAGLLRLACSPRDGEIEIVECTTAGLEAFCRGMMADRYEALLEEVAHQVARGVDDGLTLRQALPWEPGLLLTHAVETLATQGWLECSGQQFGGSCGWQIARVAPKLHAWADASDHVAAAATSAPAAWRLTAEAPDATKLAA